MKTIVEHFGKLLVLFGLLMFSASCGDDADKKQSEGDESNGSDQAALMDSDEELPVVCLWSAVSVRETPSSKGKYVTTIYLGEEATFLGEKEQDTSNAKKPLDYVKVKLADGKVGWMAARFMCINAISHAFIGNSKIYKRPDILAASKNEFERLQYVVVLEEKDDWARVKGIDGNINWFREGWVKKEKLTNEKIDVTVAVLFARALNKKTTEDKVNALNEIVDNEDLSSSVFLDNIKSKIESLNMPSGNEVSDYYNNEDI